MKVKFSARTFLFLSGEIEIDDNAIAESGLEDATIDTLADLASRYQLVIDSVGGPTAARSEWRLKASHEPSGFDFEVIE